MVPTPKEKASVNAVIRIDTAASAMHSPTLCSTDAARLVLLTAATIKNILSVPTARVFRYIGMKEILPTTRKGITATISLYCIPNRTNPPIALAIPIPALKTPRIARIGFERTQST